MGTSLPGLQSATPSNTNNPEQDEVLHGHRLCPPRHPLAAPAPEAEAEAEAEAKSVNSKHFFGGYGYNGYPLLGAGYHYPSYSGYSYGHYPSYTYPSYGHYQGYNGYRPCYGYACILRNKNKN